MKTVFLRVLDASDKESALHAALAPPNPANGKTRFDLDPAVLHQIPGSPFAYWAPDTVLSLFVRLPSLQSEGRIAASGGKTLDDFRWIRASWEIKPRAGKDWPGLAKGGAFSSYYADLHLVLD